MLTDLRANFPSARFTLGHVMRHRAFAYRGVIVGIDPIYQGSDEWYERVAKTKPPKDKPWYNLLVHEATHQTYVAEENLELDLSKAAIHHPQLWLFFDSFEEGHYFSQRMVH